MDDILLLHKDSFSIFAMFKCEREARLQSGSEKDYWDLLLFLVFLWLIIVAEITA